MPTEKPPPDRGGGLSTHCGLAASQFNQPNDTRGSEILQEFATASARACEAPVFDWLVKRLCIPHSSLIGVCRGEVHGPYWNPWPDGSPMLIVPVSYSLAPAEIDPIDLIAWEPGHPDRWFWRNGYGPALGEQDIDRAWMFSKPLILHATPLEWIRAGGQGACILDWRAPPMTIHNVETFHCSDARHAERLRRLLSEPIRRYIIRHPEQCDVA